MFEQINETKRVPSSISSDDNYLWFLKSFICI